LPVQRRHLDYVVDAYFPVFIAEYGGGGPVELGEYPAEMGTAAEAAFQRNRLLTGIGILQQLQSLGKAQAQKIFAGSASGAGAEMAAEIASRHIGGYGNLVD
jgi:hypothetical protein